MSPRVFFFVVTLLTATLVGTLTAGYFIWQQRDGKVELGGAYSLTDQTGQQVTEETFAGKWQLVFFGYTYCPDVCPTTLTTVSSALDELGGLAAKVVPVFITVDPTRDTVEQLALYHESFHPNVAMLTGTPEQVDVAAKAYRVYYAKVPGEDPEYYLMDHSSIVYLMGPDGEYLTHFSYDATPEKMAETLRANIAG